MELRYAYPVLAALLLASLHADEVRLKDGRVLVGKVVERGSVLEITTREGVVRVDVAEVAERIEDKVLRERLAEYGKGMPDTAFAHLQIALQAHAYGLDREMWQHLDQAVGQAAPAGESAGADGEGGATSLQKRLGDFLAQLEPECAGYVQAVAALGLVDRQHADQRRVTRQGHADQDVLGVVEHRETDVVPRLELGNGAALHLGDDDRLERQCFSHRSPFCCSLTSVRKCPR